MHKKQVRLGLFDERDEPLVPLIEILAARKDMTQPQFFPDKKGTYAVILSSGKNFRIHFKGLAGESQQEFYIAFACGSNSTGPRIQCRAPAALPGSSLEIGKAVAILVI